MLCNLVVGTSEYNLGLVITSFPTLSVEIMDNILYCSLKMKRCRYSVKTFPIFLSVKTYFVVNHIKQNDFTSLEWGDVSGIPVQ